jgi:cohesin loading factor subunit SCC2
MSPSSVVLSASSKSSFVEEQLSKKSVAMAVRKTKGVSDVAGNAHKKSRRGSDSTILPDSPFADTVNRIVLAAEARQVRTSNACGNIFGGSDEDCTSDEAEMKGNRVKPRLRNVPKQNDGPLTEQELSHLGVLCSSANRHFEETSHEKEKKVEFSWESVGADQLESLITMLEIHVNNASNIDVVSLAVNFLTGQSEEDDDEAESTGRKKCTIDQWLSAKLNVEASANDSSSMVGAGYRLLTTLRRGLESASVILSIMTCCNNSNGNFRRFLNEDILEACLALLKQHLTKNIVPSLSETVPVPLAPADITNPLSGKKRKRKKADKENPELNEGVHTMPCRDPTPTKDKIKTYMRKVFRAILSTHGLLTLLMERCEALIKSEVQLDDRPILAITSSVLAIFTVDPPVASSSDNVASIARGVQVVAIRLITSVVRRYPRHRVIVMEDLFPLMLKLPTSKRSLRTYPVRLTKCLSSRYLRNNSADCNPSGSSITPHWTNGGSIQVATALILSIIQSFVVMPQLEIADVEPNPKSSRSSKKAKVLRSVVTKYTSGLFDCNSACNFLATQLANRCAKKGQDGGASEFRPFLANLIDDLLVVQLLPEYPAAESLLMAFCRKLSSDLLCCKQDRASSLEITYMAIAMESLGKICAAAAGYLRYSRENPLRLPRGNSNTEVTQAASSISAPINNEEEVNRCFCERINLIDTYMIDCDRCHGWFHASCVGIARDEVPSYWVCDDCKIQIMVIEQIEVISAAISRSGAQASILEEIPIFRQLLLNHLTGTSLAGVIPDPMVAREFLLAKWIDQIQYEKNHRARSDGQNYDELGADSMSSYFLNQWITAIPSRIHSDDTPRAAAIEKHQLSDEGNSSVIRTLIAKSSELVSSFPNQLGVIVKLMGDESVNALRKLAVKAIALVCINFFLFACSWLTV